MIFLNIHTERYTHTPILPISNHMYKSKGRTGRGEEEANSLHPVSKYSQTYGILWNQCHTGKVLRLYGYVTGIRLMN